MAGTGETSTTAGNASIDNGIDSENIITSGEVGKVGDVGNGHEKKRKEDRSRDSSAETDHALRLIINIILSAFDEISHCSLESVDTLIRKRLIAHGIKVNFIGMQDSEPVFTNLMNVIITEMTVHLEITVYLGFCETPQTL
mgnify:CR=1 FL=1